MQLKTTDEPSAAKPQAKKMEDRGWKIAKAASPIVLVVVLVIEVLRGRGKGISVTPH